MFFYIVCFKCCWVFFSGIFFVCMGCNNIVFQVGNVGKIGLVCFCGVCIVCWLNYFCFKVVCVVYELDFWDCSLFVIFMYDLDFLIYSLGVIVFIVFCCDLQLFFKLLCCKIELLKIFYMVFVEYGELIQCLYYYVIIYGFDFLFDCEYWKKSFEGNDLYILQLLLDVWGNKGYVVVGDVMFEFVVYVVSYIVKKFSGKKVMEEYDDFGRLLLFGVMFVCFVIGCCWIEKWLYDVYFCDYVIFWGYKIQLFCYYDDYLKLVNLDLYKCVMCVWLDCGCECVEKDVVLFGVVCFICQDVKIL